MSDPDKPKSLPKASFGKIKLTRRNAKADRIKELKCYEDVYKRALEGWSLNELAKYIQEVKKESTDIVHKTLVAILQDWRQKIPPGTITQKRLQPVFMKAKEAVEDGIDELTELENLYKLQMGRIEIDVGLEKKMNKLMPTTGQEVRIAKEILASYADLKMDLGLSKRHIGQMDVNARLLADVAVKYEKTEIREVIANPQSRKKLLGLAERLLVRSTSSILGTQVRTDPEVIDVVATPVSSLDDVVSAEAEDGPSDDDLPSSG